MADLGFISRIALYCVSRRSFTRLGRWGLSAITLSIAFDIAIHAKKNTADELDTSRG